MDLQTEWRPATFHWAECVTDWFDKGWVRVQGEGRDVPREEMDFPDHVESFHSFSPGGSATISRAFRSDGGGGFTATVIEETPHTG